MQIDKKTIHHIAKLARIAVTQAELASLEQKLSSTVAFMEQLNEVDVEGVEPMTSVTPASLPRRTDEVSDGNQQDAVLSNAPDPREGFFAVPKVVS